MAKLTEAELRALAERLSSRARQLDQGGYYSKGDAILDRESATAIISLLDENERLKRCINMAMGCLDPMSKDRDVKLAWFRLFDAMEGKEPRAAQDGSHD